MRLGAAGLAIATMMTLFAACGGSKNSEGPTSGPSGGPSGSGGSGGSSCAPAPSAGCAQYASAFCDRFNACASYFFLVYYGSKQACVDSVSAGCQSVASLADTAIDDGFLKDCATQVSSGNCAQVWANDPFKCKAKPGKRADGKNCSSDIQCASLYCKRAMATDKCGTCAALPSEGASCKDVPSCGYGLACVEATCYRLRDLGESCVTQGAGPRCALSYACIQGKCAKPLSAGAACKVPSEQVCDLANGYACSPASNGTCKTIVSAKVGEQCNSGINLFCEGAFCKGEKEKELGTCVDFVTMCNKGCNTSPCRSGVCKDDQCVPVVIPSCE